MMVKPSLLQVTNLNIVSLRVCLNNSPPPPTDNPPPLPHSRWQHLQVSRTAKKGDGGVYGVNGCNPLPFWLHFITNICHCLPLCCRSIPFGGLTGVNTVPASCGDWWLRGSSVQVHPVLKLTQSYINCSITSQHPLVALMVHKVSISLCGLLGF